MNKNLPSSLLLDKFSSLYDLFQQRVTATPRSIAFKIFIEEGFRELSWKQTYREVVRWRDALKHTAITPGDRIGICMTNCPEWICIELACISLGVVVVPISPLDSISRMNFIINDSKLKILIVNQETIVKQAKIVQQQLEHHFSIAFWNNLATTLATEKMVTTCLSNVCSAPSANIAGHALPVIQTNDLAILLYTSGTTGTPKGVMLSHRNILSNARACSIHINGEPKDHILIAHSLAHAMEHTVGIFVPMISGASISFSRGYAPLFDELTKIKPSILIGSPAMFEQLLSKTLQKHNTKYARLKNIFSRTVNSAPFVNIEKMPTIRKDNHLNPSLANLKNPQQLFGGNLRCLFSGGAPLRINTYNNYASLNIPLLQGYGLTEAGPVVSIGSQDDGDINSVGKPLPGVKVRLSIDNTLEIQSESLFLGYWNAGKHNLRNTPWFNTKDIAEINNGIIRIKGRIDDVLIMQNGNKIIPQEIENALLQDSLFHQVCIFANESPYLSLIAVLSQAALLELTKEIKLVTLTPGEISKNKKLIIAIKTRANALLSQTRSNQKIEEIHLLENPWSTENNCLSANGKISRVNIYKKHIKTILERVVN